MYRRVDPYAYAAGYYLILPDNSIYFKPETPPEIKERFTKDWEAHLKEVEEKHRQGDFSE